MKVIKEYQPEDDKETLSLHIESFGRNKIFPIEYKYQILIALSHFPELKEVPIKFKIQPSELAFASRPDWTSVLKKEWEYLIILSSTSHKVPKELLFNNLPFNAQIGILGHELSHTVYYQHKNLKSIISIGIKYLNSTYRVKFENDTDKEAIRRGLGWQLLDFSSFCRNHPKAPQALISWLNKYYLNPSKILEEMKKIPEYNL
jgi:hypothetical protein